MPALAPVERPLLLPEEEGVVGEGVAEVGVKVADGVEEVVDEVTLAFGGGEVSKRFSALLGRL